MDKFFHWTRIGMTPMGLWPFPDKPLAELWKRSIGFLSIILGICMITAEIFETAETSTDLLVITEIICILNTNVVSIIKNCVFLFRRDLLRELLRTIDDLCENTPVPNTDGRIMKSTLDWRNNAYRTAKFLITLYVSASAICLVPPVILLIGTGTKEFIYPSKFPYDTTQLKYFIPTYIAQCFVDIAMVFICVGVESFFASVVMFICSRVDILQYSIEAATEEAILEKRTTQLFGMCVQYHVKILKVCAMLQDLYSFSLIVQFLGSVLTICPICFLLLQDHVDLEIKAKLFIYLASVFVQLFIYCSCGQILETKFENLGIRGHFSRWYNAPVSYQKDIKFYMAQCLQPVTFKAYKIMPLNLLTYFGICKTSLSYVALFQNIQNGDSQE